MARDRLRPDGGELTARQAGHGELGDDEPGRSQVEGRHELGMDLPDPSDEAVAGPGDGRASRMERVAVGGRLVAHRGQAELVRQRFDEALGVVEVVGTRGAVPRGRFGGPGEREAEAPPLGRAGLEPAVALAHLEDGDVVAPAPLVGVDDVEQAPDEVLAQDGVARRERIRDRDRRSLGDPLPRGRRPRVARPAHERGTTRLHERIRHDLGHARPGEHPAGGVADRHRVGPVRRERRVRERRRDGLEARHAGDLLRDVRLDREVGPPGRHDGGQDGPVGGDVEWPAAAGHRDRGVR